MIPACRDEISTRSAETDFTLQLHVEIKFRPGMTGQFSTWYLIRFACIFFRFFFKVHRFPLVYLFFLLDLFSLQLCLFVVRKCSSKEVFLKISQYSQENISIGASF